MVIENNLWNDFGTTWKHRLAWQPVEHACLGASRGDAGYWADVIGTLAARVPSPRPAGDAGASPQIFFFPRAHSNTLSSVAQSTRFPFFAWP